MAALIFFDINGTMIKRDTRTDLPFSNAVDMLLNIKEGMKGINTSARSDHDVFFEVLEKHNITYTKDLWQDFLKMYTQQLEAFKSTDIWRENADAISFVKALSKSEHMLSMITGELSIGAQYKLEKLGIWQFFPTGGFGEDGLTRYEIADVAYNKALKHYGHHYDECYVIGDTLLDIKTAKHLGAKVISIATGSNTKDELVALSPDYLIDMFSEIKALFI